MASPQKENGFTPIANEIMEAFCRTRIPGETRQVLDVILRKTYGWNKKEDPISLTQFVEMTGLHKSHICRALNALIDMNIITKLGNAKSLFTKSGNDTTVTYSFQKDFEKWAMLPKKVTLPNTVKYITQNGNLTLPNWGTTKERTKERTKETTIESVYFQNFWNAYPKKVGKGAALKAWKKIKSPKEILDLILIALEWQKTCDQWTKENGQFIPHPATYLNQQRWEDEPDGNRKIRTRSSNLFLDPITQEDEPDGN